MTTEQVLEKLYYDPSSPAAFAGVERLFREASKEITNLTRAQVRDWLSGQLTYTLHKQPRHAFPRHRIIVSRVNELWEADLVDLQTYARQNGGYKYILTVIDVFSKQLHVRPLKTKSAAAVVAAFKELFETATPETLRSDLGREFRNEPMKKLLDERMIKQTFARNPKTKACVAERVNRTLKERMFRHFTKSGSRRYIDVLQEIVDGYNRSYHRTIKRSPSSVTPSVAKQVFMDTYGFPNERELLRAQTFGKRRNLLAVGQLVRIKYHLQAMDKRYYPSWSDTVYRVIQVLRHEKTLYRVQALDGAEPEPRRFYRQEIQPIKVDSERVSVISRDEASRRVKIKWIGNPKARAQWIDEADLLEV